ncbi:hypothetical protein AB0D08_35865 [Kitasatospora sp. NPDC048540]|uniref:hypothetical protein n=1 Tax=Kitasatospora sp. NPDC048540 TaxID=3155634 RepID=UPI0033F0669B
MTREFLAALDSVVWDGLETGNPADPVEDVPRALRRLAVAGALAVERDCDPLYSLAAAAGCVTPSALPVALPFLVALATDPAMGARLALVDLLGTIGARGRAAGDWEPARALLADPDPEVRRAALPLARPAARLLERWRVETDRSVRLALVLALGGAAAEPQDDGEGRSAAGSVRAVLADVLAGDDPVLWVAAVYACADLDPELPVRQLDRLVGVFSDSVVQPRFEGVWFAPGVDEPCSRENVLRWIVRRLDHSPETKLSFAVRLAERASRAGDTALCREALDVLWELVTEWRGAAPAVLPVAGALLDAPDGGVRFRAASLLAALGPAAVPYADRLAGLLDDTGADECLVGTVGEVARWALARLDDPRALPGLVGQLRAQGEEEFRPYSLAEPGRPEIVDVLIPLRAHADVLLPDLVEAVRQGGARGGATPAFVAVLEAWGVAVPGAATTPGPSGDQVEPDPRAVAESVLAVAAGGDDFDRFLDALRGVLRADGTSAEVSPAVRAALAAVQQSERRLSNLGGYRQILQDEEVRALVGQALAPGPARHSAELLALENALCGEPVD